MRKLIVFLSFGINFYNYLIGMKDIKNQELVSIRSILGEQGKQRNEEISLLVPKCIYIVQRKLQTSLGLSTLIPDAEKDTITTIMIYYTQLIEAPELEYFKSVKSLFLHQNKLTSIPDNIVSLKQLEELYIDNNQIEKVPEFICLLTMLKKINLENNNIEYIHPNISKLTKLETISLRSNKLQCKNIPYSLLKMPQLKECFLDNNSKISLLDIHNIELSINRIDLKLLSQSMNRKCSLP